jgi:hypothetical protein
MRKRDGGEALKNRKSQLCNAAPFDVPRWKRSRITPTSQEYQNNAFRRRQFRIVTYLA